MLKLVKTHGNKSKKKNQTPNSLALNQSLPPNSKLLPSPPPPISTQSFPSTSNPFESLEDEDPSSPLSPPLSTALAVIHSPSQILPSPPPTIDHILTRNKVKEASNNSEPPKKAGMKSNKEIRDKTTAKEMATGTQQPMDSFLAKQRESGENIKEKSGAHQKSNK